MPRDKPKAPKFISFPGELWERVRVQAALDSLPAEELVVVAVREMLARRVKADLKAGRIVKE